MRTVKISLIASALALAAAPPVAAAEVVFSGIFSGAQEVPPNASPGAGSVIVTWDNVAMTIRIQTSFGGLTGNTTMAHLHCCAPAGANAIPATMVPNLVGFPLGVRSGTTDSGVLSLFAASTYNPAFITANGGTADSARVAFVTGLRNGNAYFNIHTSAFPGGEIRAQLRAVPEPATWGLLILGFGLVGGALRSRRAGMGLVPRR